MSVIVTSSFSFVNVGNPSFVSPAKGIENRARTGYPFFAYPEPEIRSITLDRESSSVIWFSAPEKIKSVTQLKSLLTKFFVVKENS